MLLLRCKPILISGVCYCMKDAPVTVQTYDAPILISGRLLYIKDGLQNYVVYTGRVKASHICDAFTTLLLLQNKSFETLNRLKCT